MTERLLRRIPHPARNLPGTRTYSLASRPIEVSVMSRLQESHPALTTPERVEPGVPFGRTRTRELVRLYTLRNSRGLVVRVSDWGATLVTVEAPDRTGRVAHVVLGSGDFDCYLEDFPAGATVGRFANRIAGAEFTLDGTTYRLAANNGRNALHGGTRGFAHRLWRHESCSDGGDATCARFLYRSADGEEGYPGTLDVCVTYSVSEANELRIDYEATTDRPTVVNLTNHAYFNLAGAGDVLDHELWIDADHYLPVDGELIPTGAIDGVGATPFDFRTPRRIGSRILDLVPATGGYDHNFVLRESLGPRDPCIRLAHAASGRVLEVRTTQPGVQLYTGNHFEHVECWGGMRFPRHGGVCLETQHFPDSVHHADFPSVVLRPGERFTSSTALTFAVDPGSAP